MDLSLHISHGHFKPTTLLTIKIPTMILNPNLTRLIIQLQGKLKRPGYGEPLTLKRTDGIKYSTNQASQPIFPVLFGKQLPITIS